MCMSEAEFWWNRLTHNQRAFIIHSELFNSFNNVNEPTMKEITIFVYENQELFRNLPEWPETPMRKV